MIPEPFADTLKLLSSGDVAQIRHGITQAQNLDADIAGVVKALESILQIEIFNEFYLNEHYDKFDPIENNDVNSAEESGVKVIWGYRSFHGEIDNFDTFYLENILQIFPVMTKYLPWFPTINVLFSYYSFTYFENPINYSPPKIYQDFTKNLETLDLETIDLSEIESETGIFWKEKTGWSHIHYSGRGINSLIHILENYYFVHNTQIMTFFTELHSFSENLFAKTKKDYEFILIFDESESNHEINEGEEIMDSGYNGIIALF